MRVAYLSPLPPRPSGIADYSAELLPALAEHWNLDLYTEADYRPSEELAEGFTVRPVSDFPRRAGEYDAAVYQIGNHPLFHGPLYRALQEVPGVLVLHEYVLHHMLRELTVVAGDADAYLQLLRYCAGSTGHRLGRRMLTTGIPVDPWRYPLFERAVDASRAVIVHGETARQRILASRPSAEVFAVPQHFSLGAEAEAGDRQALRAALDLPAAGLLVATYGFLSRPKRIDVCLRAFARLRRRYPEALFLLVGDADPRLELAERLAGELGVGVRWIGRTPMVTFQRYLTVSDIALNLRYPTAGETSAVLMRLLALGKAVVVSDAGAFAEIPDGCVAKIDPRQGEEETLARTLELLAGDAGLRRSLGANARRYMLGAHTLEHTAAGYARAVEETVRRKLQPSPPVPPLAPYPEEDVASDLYEAVGAHLADLGIEDGEGELLSAVSERLVDLGICPAKA
ncbi:MAG: glycosyltransferase family 4 protein [Acidobacteriota bacterium]